MKILFPEEGFGEEIHVGIASGTSLADDGKRLLGDGRYADENSIPEESDERRYTSGSALVRGWRMTGSAFR